MLHDLRDAFRGLLRTPAFTAVAVVTLALGIGANTAAFSLVRALFFSPLPFESAERLVVVMERRTTSREANIPVSGHEYAAWKEQNHVFDGLAIAKPDRVTLTGAGEPQGIEIQRASADYFRVAGLRPAIGRLFAEGEDGGGHGVTVLSDRLWRARFAADPRAIGRAVTLNDQPFTVIGILPPLPDSLSSDAWVPVDMPAELLAVGRHNLSVLARLRTGASLAEAQRDLDGISKRL